MEEDADALFLASRTVVAFIECYASAQDTQTRQHQDMKRRTTVCLQFDGVCTPFSVRAKSKEPLIAYHFGNKTLKEFVGAAKASSEVSSIQSCFVVNCILTNGVRIEHALPRGIFFRRHVRLKSARAITSAFGLILIRS